MSDNNIIEETWDKQNSFNLLRNIIAPSPNTELDYKLNSFSFNKRGGTKEI